MLLKLEGFQFATLLEINMGYYNVQINTYSRRICTIVLPLGKYEYCRLPMGITVAYNMFQEKSMIYYMVLNTSKHAWKMCY